MNDIPVTFTWQEKQYKGFLSEVNGAGSEIGTFWHLSVDKRYWGSFHYYEDRGFVFNSQLHNKEMQYLGEVFGDIVMLWYE
jgi:hypothetical protein